MDIVQVTGSILLLVHHEKFHLCALNGCNQGHLIFIFNFSPIQTEHLQTFVKKCEQGWIKLKLIDECHTRWISRIDGPDVFEKLFTYVVETLEHFSVNPESKTNRDSSIRVQALLTHILNFNFTVSLAITRKVFGFTHSVNGLLQAKSYYIINEFESIGSLIDLISSIRVNINKYHVEWYSEDYTLAQKMNVKTKISIS